MARSSGEALRSALEEALGRGVAGLSPVSGGDVNEAHRVELDDGDRLFVKSNPSLDADVFAAEADGLAWLDAAGAIRTPRVVAVGTDPGFLVLEWIDAAHGAGPDVDERMGRELAGLHRSGAPSFGHSRDNYIGPLPQPNAPAGRWANFWRERRIEPLLARAVDAGLLDAADLRRGRALLDDLERLAGPEEPPARLHGDLWGGNALVSSDGDPVVIDPAVYGGHREVDLAMMRLFGGFSSHVFGAYEEAFPLAAGAADRVPLWQLYPLLVHLHLFGTAYASSVRTVLTRY